MDKKYLTLTKPVMENALDFLSKSIEDFDNSLKFSIINFHASIELFLKARLISEHWSLVVSKKKEPDLDEFIKGDFESVTITEAINKLRKVVKINISDEFEKSIKTIANHRNKTVHFFHDAHSPEANQNRKAGIAKEQLNCWYNMRLFLESEKEAFAPWKDKIAQIEWKFKRQKDYLQIVFDKVNDKIKEYKNQRNAIKNCPSCSFPAMTNIRNLNSVNENECFVCNVIETTLVIECPECEKLIQFYNEGFAKCDSCGKEFEPDNLAAYLQHDKFDIPGNCSECDSYETVAPTPNGGYICTSCFETFDHLEDCHRCGAPNTGDMSFTGIFGCNICGESINYD